MRRLFAMLILRARIRSLRGDLEYHAEATATCEALARAHRNAAAFADIEIRAAERDLAQMEASSD